LHYAAVENDSVAVRRHLEDGADPNAEDAHRFRPLHLAAQQNSAEAALALLEAGAEVDAVNRYGNTALFIAVFNSRGDGRMIRLLRDHGASPFVTNSHGQTPVGLARLIANYPVAAFFEDVG
jgi:uncharacterized protein